MKIVKTTEVVILDRQPSANKIQLHISCSSNTNLSLHVWPQESSSPQVSLQGGQAP